MKKADTRSIEEQLAYLEQVKDEDIDFSDIPEVKSLAGAIRGKFYRPVKQHVTMRIDADILAWFKSQNPKYQTAINQVLRDYMLSRLSTSTD